MYSHEATKRGSLPEKDGHIIFNIFPRLLILVLISVSGFCRFERASAQIKVTAVTQGTTELDWTDQVGRKRWGDSKWNYDIKKGMYLEPHDQLWCDSGSIKLELTSASNSRYTTSGPFDIVVLGESDAGGFVVDLRSGEGNMQSSAPTSVPSGQINMGSPLTEYTVRVYRSDKGIVLEYVVFEGDVTITTKAPQALREDDSSEEPTLPRRKTLKKRPEIKLKTGEKVVFEATKPLLKTPVDSTDIERAAKVYAEVSTAKATLSEADSSKELVYSNFVKRYSAIFSEPNNPNHRVNLAIAQVNTRNSSDALYQLNKAERVSVSPNNTSLALIALTKGAALDQEKRPEEAQKEFQKARLLDEKVLDDVTLRNYGFNQATVDNIKLLRIRPGTAVGLDRSETGLRVWPVPLASTSLQRRVFDLIQQQRWQEAAETMGLGSKPDFLKASNSIDAYLQAIIFYELKDPKSANAAAAAALSMTGKDRLLSKTADLASREIFRATTQP